MAEAIQCLIRWHLTKEERERVSSGEDVYLFYDPNFDRFSLQLSPEGTETVETRAALVEESAE